MQETPLSAFQKKSVVLDGHEFVLHGRSDDAYFKVLGDNHEQEFLTLCRKLVTEDAVCLDIGANIGIKAMHLARHARSGRVIAAEAGQKNAECLSVNIEANNLKNVDVVNAAIGDRTTEVKFAQNSAWGHVSDEGVTVPMITLDDLAKQFSLDRIDFIKIDVEGYEFHILKSSLDLINRFGSLVLVELNPLTLLVWGNTNPREFIEWLCANFRYVYALNKGGEMLTPVIANDECRAILQRNLVDDGCVTDLLVTSRADRLIPSAQWLSEQLDRAIAGRDAAQTERNAAIAGRDAALAERDVAAAALADMKASSSWRITAPIRRFVRALRR
jgi:FkbM family methyltransferase